MGASNFFLRNSLVESEIITSIIDKLNAYLLPKAIYCPNYTVSILFLKMYFTIRGLQYP